MSTETVQYGRTPYIQAYDQEATENGQGFDGYTKASMQPLASRIPEPKSTSQNGTISTTAIIMCCFIVVFSLLVIIASLVLVIDTGNDYGAEADESDYLDIPTELPNVLDPVLLVPHRPSSSGTTPEISTTTAATTAPRTVTMMATTTATTTSTITMATTMMATMTAMTTSPTTSSTTRAMTTVPTTTFTPAVSTQSPRIAMDEQPLVCTMGSRTSSAQMFPPDGLCEYIFFDSVEKENRNLLAFPNLWDRDLRVFIAAYATYNTTSFGIGFSYENVFTVLRGIRAATNSSLLTPFWDKNIFHFGILDTDTRNTAQHDVNIALDLLKVLDTEVQVQRQLGNPSFIFFAGLVSDRAWFTFYRDRFANFYKPDLFIAQGHFFYGDNTFPNCRVMPPTTLFRPWDVKATYKHDLNLATSSLSILFRQGPSMTWALSVTMKGRWTMTLPVQGLRDFLSGCLHNTSAPSFGSYSEVCRNPDFVKGYSQVQDAILASHDTDNLLFAYDNELGLCRKLCAAKAQRLSVKFGIAVYDVDYEDFSNTCGTINKYGAFSRIHAIRGILNFFKTMFHSFADLETCQQLIT